MLIPNFRQLLTLKAKAYEDLKLFSLVKNISDFELENSLIESLEKMAKLSSHVGKNPNSGLLTFAGSMQNDDVHMLQDALSHHVSRYKTALKSMHASTDQSDRKKMRSIADQHLSKIVPLVHLAARSEPHSNGRISADVPPIRAWQANYTGHHKFKDYPAVATHPDGKITIKDPVRGNKEYTGRPNAELIGTEGWGGRPSASGRQAGHNHNNSRSSVDYRYLEMPINQNHPEAAETHHKGGFPFEDIRIGSAEDVAAGGGHIHVEDVPNIDSYVPHEFDAHPVHSIFDIPDSKFTDSQKSKFINDLNNWKNSQSYEDFLNRHAALEESSPDAYAKRGTEKPGHHFEGIPLIKQPRHAMPPSQVEEMSPQGAATDHLISYVDPMMPTEPKRDSPARSQQKRAVSPPVSQEPDDVPYSPVKTSGPAPVVTPKETPQQIPPKKDTILRKPAETASVVDQSKAINPLEEVPDEFKNTMSRKEWLSLPLAIRSKIISNKK
jgi:hypothetical protein